MAKERPRTPENVKLRAKVLSERTASLHISKSRPGEICENSKLLKHLLRDSILERHLRASFREFQDCVANHALGQKYPQLHSYTHTHVRMHQHNAARILPADWANESGVEFAQALDGRSFYREVTAPKRSGIIGATPGRSLFGGRRLLWSLSRQPLCSSTPSASCASAPPTSR